MEQQKPTILKKAINTPEVFAKKIDNAYVEPDRTVAAAADPVVQYMNISQLQKAIERTKKAMLGAAKDLDFITAAQLRDDMQRMQTRLDKMKAEQGADT